MGLSTDAEAVRLSSAVPFELRAGSQAIASHEVLIERGVDRAGEGWLYRVQIASLPDRASAQRLLASMEKETGMAGRIARERVSGRFSVRLGSWSTEAGAAAAAEGLLALGHEGLRAVSEPSADLRPSHLVLRPAGAQAVRTGEQMLVALPGAPGAWIEVEGTRYRGFIEVRVNASNRLTVVNAINLEDYLRGVVPAELSPDHYPRLEAIKAQAVAARTYAWRHRGQYAAEGFDLCATPACQVYRGVSVEHRLGNEAVAATAGEVLTYGGELVDALYTSTCGGRTEDVENVFSGPARPYLVSRSCHSEEPPAHLISTASLRLSPDAAGAVVLGLVGEEELASASLAEPVRTWELAVWVERALQLLGQRACRDERRVTADQSASNQDPPGQNQNQPARTQDQRGGGESEPVHWVRLAAALTAALCLESRLPFLLSPQDAGQLVPETDAPGISDSERRAVAYWILEQVLRPDPAGFNPWRSLSRLDLLESLYRLVSRRGEPPLASGTLVAVEGENLRLRVEDKKDKEDREEVFPLAPKHFLFRRVGATAYFSPAIPLQPGDRLAFHRGAFGVDLVELQSTGASLDRSSAFSSWMVRKTSAELTAEVGARQNLGVIRELRPKRYGRSGRVAELEIEGSERSLTLRGLAIRTWLGIRENLFFIDRQLAPDGTVAAWVFSGRGWGHGVGLCQVGAFGLASTGAGYREILGHYYPGTVLSSLGRLGASLDP